jgi:hypothetical protein
MTSWTFPLAFFEPVFDGKTKNELKNTTKQERRLCCAACGNAIARETDRSAINGSHAHRFTNPLGLTFDIGCFAHAPGIGTLGDPSFEHTWFAGFAWQIGVCAKCQEHLGWRYVGTDGKFYGLILSRLVSSG